MTTASPSVAVCSRSFSAHPVLRAALIAQFPNTRFNDSGRTLEGPDLIGFLHGAQRVVVALERIDAALLDAVPTLDVVAKYGVGLDRLDLRVMSARGVRLGWTPGVNAQAVAEVVAARTIDLVRGLSRSDAEVRTGLFRQVIGRELQSVTIGLLGCGHVGKAVAGVFRAFGAAVVAHDLRNYSEFYARSGVRAVGFEELLTLSDVLSVHVPLTPRTRLVLGASEFSTMKPGAVLINTARGGIVDEQALADALTSGHLAGAAVDVFDREPPIDSPLLGAPNVLLSAHLGGSSESAVMAMGLAAIEGLSSHLPADHYFDHVA